MTERPIIFSGPMVRALLAGRKTQTRRIVKGVDECPHGYDGVVTHTVPKEAHFVGQHCFQLASGETAYIRCPYGAPGDRLWVRETFMREIEDGTPTGGFIYRASDRPEPDGEKPLRWTPAIHMKRVACRLRLEVTGVRIERLQEISEKDSRAEGIDAPTAGSYRAGYARLWNSLNEKRAPWGSNPWVWVIEFRRANGT